MCDKLELDQPATFKIINVYIKVNKYKRSEKVVCFALGGTESSFDVDVDDDHNEDVFNIDDGGEGIGGDSGGGDSDAFGSGESGGGERRGNDGEHGAGSGDSKGDRGDGGECEGGDSEGDICVVVVGAGDSVVVAVVVGIDGGVGVGDGAGGSISSVKRSDLTQAAHPSAFFKTS